MDRKTRVVRVRFIGPYGAEIFVPVEGASPRALNQRILEAQRTYGGVGWHTGEPPAGGFQFSMEDEAEFDWRILGARAGTATIDGTLRHGVWRAGKFYERRHIPAEPRKCLPEVVRYSRHARQSEHGPHVEESGKFRYIALAVFRPDRRPRPEVHIPPDERRPREQAPAGPPAASPEPTAPAPPDQLHVDPATRVGAMMAYLRRAWRDIPQETGVTLSGRTANLREHVLARGAKIQEDPAELAAVVEAIAAALPSQPFDLAAEVESLRRAA
ncbi:MAG TPA: single-stranded DNA-binding protein [Longimicrobiaceae bacterium]